MLTCESEQVFDSEPGYTDSLDERKLGIVDGLALQIPVLNRRDRVQGHANGGDDNKCDGYHRDHLEKERKGFKCTL